MATDIMVKVYIEMDQCLVWFPISEKDKLEGFRYKKATMEIPTELLKEYNIASTLYRSVQDKLEALYRVQHGLEPFQDQVIPEHKLLKENNDE